MSQLHTPVLLAILDGFGLAPAGPGNAVTQASKPCIDGLFERCPNVRLAASGPDVGLPEGQMGNSEVGHLNIGAGRIVFQELSRINNAVADRSLFENQVLCDAIDAACECGGTVHCMGLLSDGGVHSEMSHLEAILRMACERGAKRVRVHAFMDGRDVPPTSGAGYLEAIDRFCSELSVSSGSDVRVATVSGRFYAMDRDTRWERVDQAYRALVSADAPAYPTTQALIEDSYAHDVTDEFVVPAVVDGAHDGIHDGDAVIFYNFRPDRAREMTRAFVDDDFSGFERASHPQVSFVCLTEYDPTIPAPIAFPKVIPENVLADVLADAGLRQYHIAETEKYAHVTFFLNGGSEAPKAGEERVLIPSPKEVPTYDLKPQMSAPEVAKTLADAISADASDVYIVNFANCDMVGHTGSLPAAIKAVEAVDAGLSQVLEALAAKGGSALVTADHGNAEKMIDEDGVSPHTAHTLSPVPLILVGGEERKLVQREGARLADIAPTLLDLMGMDVPDEWTGRSMLG
jgi:2,3-bisphosphoglycerate-independent phosphoglycerate mutase